MEVLANAFTFSTDVGLVCAILVLHVRRYRWLFSWKQQLVYGEGVLAMGVCSVPERSNHAAYAARAVYFYLWLTAIGGRMT